jgi:hypothetical protein
MRPMARRSRLVQIRPIPRRHNDNPNGSDAH